MPRTLSRPSHSTVVAYLALFVALGGTSYAATTLSKNSVRSTTIVNGQVKSVDIGRGAVNSAKVADGSLLAKDFKPGQLPAGPQGPQGAQGPQGPAGPKGVNRIVIRSGGPGSDRAFCQGGEVALGGGGNTEGFLYQSQPLPFNVDVPAVGWEVGYENVDGTEAFGSAWVICAS